MKKFIAYLLPLTLFAASLILRMSLVSKGAYNVDCLNLVLISERAIREGTLPYLFGTGYPLTVILGILSVFLSHLMGFYNSVMAVNMMSVIFSSLCIPVAYFLFKKLSDSFTALLASVFLSVCPLFLSVSTYGVGHSPALFFLLLGLLLTIKGKETSNGPILATGAMCMGLLGTVRLQEMILMMVPVMVLIFKWPLTKDGKTQPQRRNNFDVFLCYCCIAGITALLFYLPYLLGPEAQKYISQLMRYKKASTVFFIKGQVVTTIIIAYQYLTKSLSPIGLILSVLGLFVILNKSRRLFLFIGLWIMIPLIFFTGIFTLSPRFFVMLLPALTFSAGLLLTTLIRLHPSISAAYLILYASMLFICLNRAYPPLWHRHQHDTLPEYCRWLDKTTEGNAVIIANDDYQFINLYAKRKTLIKPFLYIKYFEDLEPEKYRNELRRIQPRLNTFKNHLDKLLEKGIPVYISHLTLYAYDSQKLISNFIKDNYNLDYKGTHLYEDWHRGAYEIQLFNSPLYRLSLKE